jgi:hypothetical protein
VQIGLEVLCAADLLNPDVEDRFVYVIAHEFAHVQQAQELVDNEHPTVLEMSLIEGAAEFTAELIAGKVAYAYLDAATAGARRTPRRRSSAMSTRPIFPTGSTTARRKSRLTLATGSAIASSRAITSAPPTSARHCGRFSK